MNEKNEKTWWDEVGEYAAKNELTHVETTPRYNDCAVCGGKMREGAGYRLADGSYVHTQCVLTLKKLSERAAERVQQDIDAPAGYVRMSARYAGRCEVCGEPIVEREDIYWKRGNGARHARCAGGRLIARDISYETEQDRLDVEGEPLIGGCEVWGGPAD